ncbi:unnamed protein product [Effrenium voratum]|nr:unnamed protein product [Effrenium voratum]
MAEKLASVVGPLAGGQVSQLLGHQAALAQLVGVLFLSSGLNQLMLTETMPKAQVQRAGSWQRYRELLQDTKIQEAALVSAVYWGASAGSLFCLLPLMLTKELNYGAQEMSLVFAGLSLLGLIAAKPAAALADRLGRKGVLVPGISLVGLATLLLPLTPQIASSLSCAQSWVLVAALGLFGLGQGIVGPALPFIFTDGIKAQLHVESLSLLRISTEVGAVALTLFMSFLVERNGFAMLLALAGVSILCAAARFSCKYRRSSNFV